MNILMFLIFIIIAISVYTLLNFYFIHKHFNVLTYKTLPGILWRLFFITMAFTPIATAFLSRKGHAMWAGIFGIPGYIWLAFLFLFLAVHGISDIVFFICEKAGKKPTPSFIRAFFAATVIFNILILTYGFFEARHIRVKHIELETYKLPENIDELTILQISDTHFSPMLSTDAAEKIVNLANKEKPDIIVSTGDLLDHPVRNREEVISVLNRLQAPMGKYAVTGNHEFISGIDYSSEFTEQAGFTYLRDSSTTVNNAINLVGVDDPTGTRMDSKGGPDEEIVLKDTNTNLYTILLKHQPDVTDAALDRIDLQLSGHTHGGQIFPFTLLVRLSFKYVAGLYTLDRDTKLYVSRGTGTWGPPIRFLCFPEITVITLKRTVAKKCSCDEDV